MKVTTTPESVKTQLVKYTLTLFVPLFGFIYSLIRRNNRSSKNIFWMACVFLGMIFIYNPTHITTRDSIRYSEWFVEMHSNSNLTFSDVVSQYYSPTSLHASTDIYEYTMRFLVSRFTDNPRIYFIVIAFVFGYFYSRNLWYIFDRLPSKVGFYVGLSILLFLYILPLNTIVGIRFGTAAHVFAVGAMPLIIEKDKKKVIWCFLSLLIHYSFIIPLIILMVYHFIPKTKMSLVALLGLYIITFSINTINLTSVNDFLKTYNPNENVEVKIDYYTNEEYSEVIEEVVAENNLFIRLIPIYAKYLIFVLISLSYYCWNRWLQYDKTLTRLLIFVLLFFSLSNIATLIPSGSRYQTFGMLFLIPLFIFVLERIPKRIYMRLRYSTFLFMPLIVLGLREDFDYYSVNIFTMNFFTAPFFETDVPLITFVKQLLLYFQ